MSQQNEDERRQPEDGARERRQAAFRSPTPPASGALRWPARGVGHELS
jgi:hypothetical protein